jgi:hypothetical protein
VSRGDRSGEAVPPPLADDSPELRREGGALRENTTDFDSPRRSGARTFQASVVFLALIFFAFHLPYLPASLEDLDSVNFALGIRQYDVARHQPHPPGYPVFIVIAKAVRAAAPSDATALALVSIVAGTLGVLAMAALFRRLDRDDGPSAWPTAAAGVAMTAPLYWFTAARPLSDVAGLAAALAVQAMTLGATSVRALAVAGFCAGLAAGLRSQVVWLTVPLLIVKLLAARGWLLAGRGLPPAREHLAPGNEQLATSNEQRATSNEQRATAPALAAFVGGLLLWFIPLVIVTGGPAAYWRALFAQGAEDFGNIQMLWNVHGARDVLDALYFAFIAPWATWPVAAVVLVCAALGVVWSYRRRRHGLIALAAAFGPYLLFDLVFQEAFTSRYALPLVVPMAYLAVSGLRVLPYETGLAVAVAVAMFDAHVGGTSIAAYAHQKAPAFRLLDEMGDAARSAPEPPVLAMDRRQDLDFRRPIAWAGDSMPAIARKLPAPPQHEWLEAVKYWNGGGRAPVWFVVDPMRTSIDLVQHGDPVRYRWPLPYPVLVGGARPNQMDWYRVDRPEWYVGEGWALTPEAAGVAETDRRGPSNGPISGWVARSAISGGTLMIGGRNFDAALRPKLTVTLDGRAVLDEPVMPGPFLRFVFVDLPFLQWDGAGGEYGALTVATSAGSRIAIEQFDASVTRPLLGFGPGWQEQEFNPRTGLRWRWLSERGELKTKPPPIAIPNGAGRPGPSSPRALHLDGESPRKYFARGSRLVVRSGDRVLFDQTLSDDFSLNIPIDAAAETISLETDQVFAPADRSRRSADRRHLGLRIFKCELRPAH